MKCFGVTIANQGGESKANPLRSNVKNAAKTNRTPPERSDDNGKLEPRKGLRAPRNENAAKLYGDFAEVRWLRSTEISSIQKTV